MNVCTRVVICLPLVLAGATPARAAEPVVVVEPKPAPGALDNPLKGWCVYPNIKTHQPHSMTFHYVSWKELEPMEGVYAFQAWQRRAWEQPGARGKRLVIRVWVDYPRKESGLPDWLRERGVRETPYSEHGGGLSPDYDHPVMLAAMEKLIAALGERYNDHPRVAFLQIGLLGFWGEWHCYPRNELYASPATETRVLAAYHRALPDKHLLVRNATEASGSLDWIGFHDENFPEDTDGPDWAFLPKLRRSGRDQNWRRAPIGGEMVPGQAGKWMGAEYEKTLAMIDRAHFTWMGPYSPAQEDPAEHPEAFQSRCEALVRRMGYDFRITKFGHDRRVTRGRPFQIALLGENLGVAPFYYEWPCELALIDDAGRVVASQPTGWDIRRWAPDEPFNERATLRFDKIPAGDYRVGLGIRDPWKGEPAIAFANEVERVGGWSLLSRVVVRDAGGDSDRP